MPTQSRNTLLLATDRQNSVMNAVGVTGVDNIPYTVYGHSSLDTSLSRLRFNGELRELMIGNYFLGNGYRMYSPMLGRFFSPDRLSPFGKGGMNAYAYCGCDSVNRIDPTGKSWLLTLTDAPFPRIPRAKITPNPVQLTISTQRVIPDAVIHLDKRGRMLAKVINNESEISRVPAVKLQRAKEQAAAQARVQESLPQTEAWVKTQLREHVPTKNWDPIPPITKQTQSTLISTAAKPHTTWSLRQLGKLSQAESSARHSHNMNDVFHYQNKLIRNGFDYQ